MAAILTHVHIRADDPRAAAEWLRAVFGWSVEAEIIRDGGERFVRCFAGDPAQKVVITSALAGETPIAAPLERHFGLEHFGVDVDDLDATLADIVGSGGKVIEGPYVGHRGNRIAFATSPFGIIIEIADRL